MQAKGYFEEDFQEAFQRYMSRSEIEALRSQLGQRSEVGEQRSEGERKKPEASEQRPESEGQKKDETGETPGGEDAAA